MTAARLQQPGKYGDLSLIVPVMPIIPNSMSFRAETAAGVAQRIALVQGLLNDATSIKCYRAFACGRGSNQ
jgi:hypothetical protein